LSASAPRIPWHRGLAALFVCLSGGTLAAFAMLLLLAVFQGGGEALSFVILFAPIILVPAIIPALLSGLLLLHKRWLRLSHFLAAGGVSGAVSPYAWIVLTGGLDDINQASGLIVLTFFAGVAGGASAWAYLRLKNQIPQIPARPAP
jgi:hypothetical protein